MRYSRQEALLGRDQKKLFKSLVTIVGCGGTGSAAAEYLARAGVNLRLIDRDIVDMTNMHRQLFREEDVGKPKAEALKERLEEANSEIRIDAINDDLNFSNAEKLLSKSSVILDGTDNMETRFLLNDFCLKNKIPFTYAAAVKSEGLLTFITKETPCLRCFIHSSSRDTCETAGVLGPAAGTIGVLSAAEAIKHLTGKEILKGQLLHINLFANKFELIEIQPKKDCPACKGNYEYLSKPAEQVTELCGSAYQYLFKKPVDISGVAASLEKNRDFALSRHRSLVQIVHKNYIISLFKNRMIVQNAGKDRKRTFLTAREVRALAAKIIGV